MTNIPPDDFDENQLFSPPPIRAPMQKSNNPLQQYFRMPGCHVPLPTRGAFFPQDGYEPTMSEDVAVFPMRAADEILLQSPDALMSGYALEKLLESCVPAIKYPRLVSTPDLDVLLLAIRAASNGDVMDIEIACPECGHVNQFECHLPSMIATMTFVDPVNVIKLTDDLSVFVRPYNLDTATKAALGSFQEIRRLQAFPDPEEGDSEEVKEKKSDAKRMATNESYLSMSKLNMKCVADSIICVRTPNGDVTDPEFILQFVNQTSQKWVKKIEKKLEEINGRGIDKHINTTCAKCNHNWSPEVEFDPVSFFGQSS